MSKQYPITVPKKEARSEKVTWLQFLLTIILLALFPTLWLFNQRLNYRKFLTLNTKFGLYANTYPADQLSNPTLVLKYLQKFDPNFTITSKMGTVAGFDVLGRELTNGKDFIVVYEYQSPRAASAKLKNFSTKPELFGQISDQVYLYKNVLIFDKSSDIEIQKLLEQLTNANNK